MTMRSKTVGIGILAILTAQLTGCALFGPDEAEPTDEAVCMKEDDQTRAEDADCESGRSGHSWIFYRIGSVSHPPVGKPVAPGFTTTRPASGFKFGGVPRSGGFGTHGGSVSG